MSALCSLYRSRHYFWQFVPDVYLPLLPLSLAHLHEGRGSLALAWSSQPVLGSWDLGELPAVLQCAGSPLPLAPATLNSAFLLPASFRIQYRGALCCVVNTDTLMGVHTHPHFYKPLKETRPKAERGADASQMLGLASFASWHRRPHTR